MFVAIGFSGKQKVTTRSSPLFFRPYPCLHYMLICVVPDSRRILHIIEALYSVKQIDSVHQATKKKNANLSVLCQGSILGPTQYNASILETFLPLPAGSIRMTSPFGKGSSSTKLCSI